MIRVLLYVFVVVLLGMGFGWIANHPGDLVITFGQTRIAVSILVAGVFIVLLIAAIIVLWWLLRIVFSSPQNITKHFEIQRQSKGRDALSKGLLAAFSGDFDIAQRMNKRAGKYLECDKEPLTKLLDAQTSLLHNDTEKAVRIYEEMTKLPDAQLLGLHGLFREAIKSGAFEAAGQYAERAIVISPAVKWANRAMLDRLSADGAWDKALELFDRAQHVLPRSERESQKQIRRRVVLLTGQATSMAENHIYDARKLALKAQKIDPDFVPATTLSANILYKMHEERKANKLIEALWKKTTHPDLAAAYLNIEERATDRLKRAKTLASYNPQEFDSYYIVAKAALDAGEVKFAREQAEKAILKQQRESGYLLLADIEEVETGQQGRVRQWVSLALRGERDPVWIADGMIFDEWAAVSPVSGQLDVFEWCVPSRQLGSLLDTTQAAFDKKPMLEKEQVTTTPIIIDNIVMADNVVEKKTTAPIPNVANNVSEQDTKIQTDTVLDAVKTEEAPTEAQKTHLRVDDPGIDPEMDVRPAVKNPFKVF